MLAYFFSSDTSLYTSIVTAIDECPIISWMTLASFSFSQNRVQNVWRNVWHENFGSMICDLPVFLADSSAVLLYERTIFLIVSFRCIEDSGFPVAVVKINPEYPSIETCCFFGSFCCLLNSCSRMFFMSENIGMFLKPARDFGVETVSYTHLTLPTIA